MSEGARLAAVVVSYEGGAVTDRCVRSLLRSRGLRPLVLLVDNGSCAEERARLRERWGGREDVELVQLEENRHFAGGVNAGAERALERGASEIVFLNNDTELEPDCLALLAAAARADPGAGVVGPALLDLGDRRPLSLGERYGPWSLAVPRTLLKVRSPGPGEPYRVGGVMGAVILVTRDCWERVGPYREDLLVYYEEVDFCLRARRLGFRPLIVPRAVALHDGLRDFPSGLQPYAARLKCRNLLWLMRSHGARGAWLAFAPVYATVVGASAVLYGLRGRWDVVRALGAGVAAGLRGPPRPGVRP